MCGKALGNYLADWGFSAVRDLWLSSLIGVWLLALVEGVIILALMRQVGTLLLRVGSSPLFDAGTGPPIGDVAPWLPDGNSNPADGRGTLLVFVSLGCGVCDLLLPGLGALVSSYGSRFRINAVGKEDAAPLAEWAGRLRARLSLTSSPEAFDRFAIRGTPYAFVVDAQGIIRARGGVNHTEQLESLLQQCLHLTPAIEPETSDKTLLPLGPKGD